MTDLFLPFVVIAIIPLLGISVLLLFAAHKTYTIYSENIDVAWKNANNLTGCSIIAMKYGFHNYGGGSFRLLHTYQIGKISTQIGSLKGWIGADTEVLKTYKESRYKLKEYILITDNHTHSMKIFHPIVYYFIKVCWVISIVLIPFTMGISILCMGIFAIITAPSNNYMNFIRVLGKQSMESLGFEKSFDAFSKDPIEARMIITPAFMDRLEQFSDKWKLNGKIRIILEKDTFTLLLKGDIEKYGKESDGSYALIKSMEEILNLNYYSINTNNQ